MGFTPQQVNDMSMWQFFAALNGFNEANSPKKKGEFTEEEADAFLDWVEGGGGPRTLSTQTYWWDERGPISAGVVTFTVN